MLCLNAMNSRLCVALACLTACLTGCSLVLAKKPTLSQEAESVRLLVKAEPPITCSELDWLSTENDWFATEEDVRIRLRNDAAKLGANVATLDVLQQDGNLWAGSGRAFRCQQ